MLVLAVLAVLAHGHIVQPPPVAVDDEAGTPAGGEERAPQVYDGEVPPRHDPPPSESPPPVQARRPGSGFSLELGVFFGGADLVRADYENGESRTLTAGGGGAVSVGYMWTPRWSEKGVGVGVGFNLGFKGAALEATNGSAALTRFPLLAAAHLLFPASSHLFFVLRGGVTTDLGVSLSGKGTASRLGADLSSGVGPLVEVGFLSLAGSRSGFGLAVRFSALEYTLWGPGINASSVGLVGSWHYHF
jgi:hypothetical protein